MEIQTEREIERQMGNGEMQKHTYRKADVQTDEAMEGEFDGQTSRQTDRWTDGWKDLCKNR